MAKKQTRPGWPYKKEFECHRCGNCCRGAGFVEMSQDDLSRAAAFLGVSEEDFRKEYCREVVGEVFLKDQEDELVSCIFLFEDEQGLAGCRIHGAKPAQCSAFPFQWRPRNVLQYCDGMRALEGLPPTKPQGKRDIDAKRGRS